MSKIVNTRTTLQMEAVECGAASLCMVLEYYGKYIPLEKLRVDCGVSRDGSKAVNILKAARAVGMEAKGFKKEPKDLLNMTFPVIIFWNFNHFLVLEGFNSKKEAYINDPSSGKRVLSYEEFDDGFTGVVLTFEKTQDFKADSKRPSIFPSLLQRLKSTKSTLVLAVITGILLTIPGLMVPIFSKVYIDNYLIKGMDDWVKPLLFIMIGTAIVNIGLNALQKHFLLKMETSLSLRESSKFFWHILQLPMDFFNQRMSGEISNRIMLNSKIAQVISGQLAENIIGLFSIFFYAALMFYYDTVLTLIGICFVLLNFLLFKKIINKMTLKSQKIFLAQGRLLGITMGGLQSIETLKATATEDDFFVKFSAQQAKLQNANNEMVLLNQAVLIIPTLFSSLNIAFILVLGSFRVMDGYLTIGMLVAFQSLMQSFSAPVNQILGMSATIKELEGDMHSVDDVLKYPIEKEPLNNNQPLKNNVKLHGNIQIKNISFGYSSLAPALVENFTLNIKAGERVALIGSSGSGKSTIAKVLTGLYTPWSGEILIDGTELNEIDSRVRTNSISIVSQNITIFAGTIKENITLWDDTRSDAEIIQACKDANIHEHIASLPNGYETILDEKGSTFSGGQKQRLEIARAFISNPSILILDEATSALDPITEMHIDESLRQRGCTSIIIAHRLSTIRDADNIVVLQWGKIKQQGTHEILKNTEGLYKELIRSAS